jgi:hypothetical protein
MRSDVLPRLKMLHGELGRIISEIEKGKPGAASDPDALQTLIRAASSMINGKEEKSEADKALARLLHVADAAATMAHIKAIHRVEKDAINDFEI